MNWEYIHLISHPFAIVLPLVGAVVGLAGWAAGRDDLERYGVLSILLGGIAALPSYYSGITAADEVAQRTFVAPGVVQDHRTWATWAAVLLVTSAIFAGYSMFQPAEARLRRFVLVAGSAAALVTALAAFRGGQIEHGDDDADQPTTPAVLEESIQ